MKKFREIWSLKGKPRKMLYVTEIDDDSNRIGYSSIKNWNVFCAPVERLNLAFILRKSFVKAAAPVSG